MAKYLADASNTLEKIKQTAENVTTCQVSMQPSSTKYEFGSNGALYSNSVK
jgi:hypothetical protein